MATFTNFGFDPDFLYTAFATMSGGLDAVSVTSTRAELLNPETGARTVLTGAGLRAITVNGEASLAGTVTGATFLTPAGETTFTIADVAWNATSLIAATNALVDTGDDTQINALLNRQPITVDATGSVQGLFIGYEGLTINQTLLGSRFGDDLVGGTGNDTIKPGAAEHLDYVSDLLIASAGNDTYDLRDRGIGNFTELDYSAVTGPITATLNGVTNTGTVTKTGQGTDSVLGVQDAMKADGLAIIGTTGNDVFNLTPGLINAYAFVAGGRGNDTFNLTLNGYVRIGFHYDSIGAPISGVNVNLITGVVGSDGFGGRDQINILGGTGRLQLQGTDFADTFVGSTRDEQFILQGGNDTVSGGGGFDLLLYNRGGMSSGIDGNLDTGLITGAWQGTGFRHTISNITDLRGSDLDDRVVASVAGSWIEGRYGNDTLIGGTGSDGLYGGYGDDILRPGWNSDYDDIDAGGGFDEIVFDPPAGAGQEASFFVLNELLEDPAGIRVEIDTATAPNGTIYKAFEGETLLTGVRTVMTGAYLAVFGTRWNDIYNIVLQADERLEVRAGVGADLINGSGTGGLTIVFSRDSEGNYASQGAVINLATGVVANDGFGTADTLALGADLGLTIFGTRLADTVTGSALNTKFNTMGGNDTITGGTGFEFAEYLHSGHTAGVRVDLAAGTAKGAFEGVAFAQRLSGIEGVTGTAAFDDLLFGSRGANALSGLGGNDHIYGDGFRAGYAVDAALQVYRLYQAMLDRAPDTAGQVDWTSRIVEGTATLRDVANGFLGSQEYLRIYGGLDNTGFVTLLYNNVLDRAPDLGGLNDWLARLSGGASRAEIALGFSESREFATATRAAALSFTGARVEAGWTDDVYRLYGATLNREPDAAGFSDWIGRLGGGTSFLTAVSGFIGSREFTNVYGSLDNTAFVTLLYRNVLDRAPDLGGLNDWLAQMAAGTTRAQVVEGFAQSREFVQGTAGALLEYVRGLGDHDVIQGGTGSNDLWGGMLSDQFDFYADQDGLNRVMDLESWDYLAFHDFGYGTATEVRSHMRQDGANAVFEDQGVTVILTNIQLTAISDSIFITDVI